VRGTRGFALHSLAILSAVRAQSNKNTKTYRSGEQYGAAPDSPSRRLKALSDVSAGAGPFEVAVKSMCTPMGYF